jgi:hypothetical protein
MITEWQFPKQRLKAPDYIEKCRRKSDFNCFVFCAIIPQFRSSGPIGLHRVNDESYSCCAGHYSWIGPAENIRNPCRSQLASNQMFINRVVDRSNRQKLGSSDISGHISKQPSICTPPWILPSGFHFTINGIPLAGTSATTIVPIIMAQRHSNFCNYNYCRLFHEVGRAWKRRRELPT